MTRHMVKTLLLAVVVAIAASIADFGFSPLNANAARPIAVTIDLFPTQFCCPEIGTWQATGAINDSGTYVKTASPDDPSIPEFCNPQHIGAFREGFLLTGSQGTLAVNAEELLIPTGEFCPPSTGVWQVESATGAYAGISGHGSSQFFKEPQFDLRLTGVISRAV